MFYYISGTLALKTENFAVIDAGGVGYRLYASTKSLETLGEVGSDARLFTYVNFKPASDIFDLYGFATQEEKNLFEMIIGVSRVGAKTAIALLSNISPSKFALCVATNDYKYIAANTPGLGAKGAERIVLELKTSSNPLTLKTFPKMRLLRFISQIQAVKPPRLKKPSLFSATVRQRQGVPLPGSRVMLRIL